MSGLPLINHPTLWEMLKGLVEAVGILILVCGVIRLFVKQWKYEDGPGLIKLAGLVLIVRWVMELLPIN